MQVCPNCGHSNTSSKFCIKCGTLLASSAPVLADQTSHAAKSPAKTGSQAELLPSAAASEAGTTPARQPTAEKKSTVAIASAIGVVLLGLLLYRLMTPSHEQKKYVDTTPSSSANPQPSPIAVPTPPEGESSASSGGSAAPNRNLGVTYFEIRDLVDRYLNLQMSDDIGEIMSLYGETVDFYDKGYVAKEFVQEDKQKYFARWPSRSYVLVSELQTREILSDVRVSFEYTFDVRNVNSSRRGKASCQLTLQRIDGQGKIVGEKGKVVEKY